MLTILFSWPFLKVKVNRNSIVKKSKTETCCISPYVSVYARVAHRLLVKIRDTSGLIMSQPASGAAKGFGACVKEIFEK